MSKIYDILVVDDEFGMREGVARVLRPYGHNVSIAQDGKEAYSLIRERNFDLALIDLKLPDADGLEILDSIQEKDPLTVCIIITAYATLDTAISATKRGAFDYLAKPFTTDDLLVVVDKALDRRDIIVEAEKLRRERDLSLLELTREQTRFKTIISCMADGVIVTNRNGEIVLYNEAGSRFLKDPVNTGPGSPVSESVKVPQLVELIARADDSDNASHVMGQELAIEDEVKLANCAILRDERGEFLGTVIVLRDITEMKEIEKMKSRFISLVAHELKAPVAAIKGYLDIILKRAAGDNEETYKKMMERSRERADGLINLIGDLLTMSRIDMKRVERHIQPVSICDVIKENVEFFKPEAEKYEQKLVVHLPDEQISARVDPDEFNRIFTNILSNAIKYTYDGGSITISAGKKGERVFFSVEDTGIGMSEEERGRLFDDFFRANNELTRKKSGTGLGMAITRRMIESNFGTIEVESTLGKGSTFTVVFPSAL